MRKKAMIPVGMALVAVEFPAIKDEDVGRCRFCFLNGVAHQHLCLACSEEDRVDRKDVIFQLVEVEEIGIT